MDRIAAIVLCLLISFSMSAYHGGSPASQPESSMSQKKSLEASVEVLKTYDGLERASLMRVGKTAMVMARTIGKASGDSWLRMVAKAFKRVNSACLLDYGECPEETRAEIESGVRKHLIESNLVLRGSLGEIVTDETYGETSKDGKHVSDLIIILPDQDIICIRGTIAAEDVERTVGRLKRSLL